MSMFQHGIGHGHLTDFVFITLVAGVSFAVVAISIALVVVVVLFCVGGLWLVWLLVWMGC